MDLPDCPACNGQTELNGLGGVHCFFCGFDTGRHAPVADSISPPGSVEKREPAEVLPMVKQGGKTFYKTADGKLLPLIDNLPNPKPRNPNP